jgi:hypothetical protein
LTWLLAALIGCGTSGQETAYSTTTTSTSQTAITTETGSTVTAADLLETVPTGGCGMPEFDWASLERMGEVVHWEQQEGLSFTPEVMDILLTKYGLTAYLPTKHSVEVYTVRYVSQDRGQEVEVTGILSFPVLDEPAEVPILLQTHPTMGFADDCAPSSLGLQGAALNMLFSAHGFAVAGPDYLGMKGSGEASEVLHPYVHPESTAITSIDSLRALVQFAAARESVNAIPQQDDTYFFGASEGGFAALWAERYMASYAPEFTARAVVASVPPVDLVKLAVDGVSYLHDTTWGGVAVLATQHQWYGEGVPNDTIFTNESPNFLADSVFDTLAASCGDYGDFASATTPDDVYTATYIDALEDGDMDAIYPWGCYLENGVLASERIPLRSQTPTLIVGSGEDELVTVSTIRESIGPLCDLGYEIEYHECEGADHVDGVLASAGYQWEWLQARMAGEPLGLTCVVNPPVDCEQL